ncbi:hypothetical protein QR680_011455 [Steinernema hermaphroditum]|uniref:Uncharacterized protein n=1 Tax=Steinernema hermaphroditum TaxID=289476 RepID=A0AA39HYK4_9BILA|nr:hypothetical protein QR680_011455 [Steinernema hermaphroditum]
MGTPKACAPYCRVPDKRDFMDALPERQASDFYEKYDPTVGVATALILILFFLVVTLKSIVRCIVQKIQKYQIKKHMKRMRIEMDVEKANGASVALTNGQSLFDLLEARISF